MPKKTKPTFEEAVQRLEELIESMEDGSSPLTELVAKYEEGSKLLKECQSQLQEAELKIEKLNLKTGEPEPFSSEEEES
ncbi:exodeoxyribonuclease VII small subunit [Coraliomargarita sinensis]|uniref:Exodeoxyribonuclease 7 small subunit n=1 Tax=Coraliomargarita sinensis TaxID=2174842 RepID=A0A317ZFN2_9BACT|nr:exodeoxyribonuclease VII small subunit [Coraliomargarita sinensis]PXA04190.1 exodeoxyribonuclease VII small subunit [Coraliomargarita sinensis]